MPAGSLPRKRHGIAQGQDSPTTRDRVCCLVLLRRSPFRPLSVYVGDWSKIGERSVCLPCREVWPSQFPAQRPSTIAKLQFGQRRCSGWCGLCELIAVQAATRRRRPLRLEMHWQNYLAWWRQQFGSDIGWLQLPKSFARLTMLDPKPKPPKRPGDVCSSCIHKLGCFVICDQKAEGLSLDRGLEHFPGRLLVEGALYGADHLRPGACSVEWREDKIHGLGILEA